jgi:hypothetical protein
MSVDKVLENKARRVLSRRGYRLLKSHRRDKNAFDYGGYMVVDDRNNVLIGCRHNEFDATWKDVGAFLVLTARVPA